MPILLYLDRRQVERRGDDGHPRRANDTRNRSRNGEDEIIGLGDQSGDHECFRDHPDTPLIDRLENQAFGLLVTMAIVSTVDHDVVEALEIAKAQYAIRREPLRKTDEKIFPKELGKAQWRETV